MLQRKLVWSDEFDGSGSVDTTRWGFELGMKRNGEAQTFTDRLTNVRREDGMLVIEVRKEALNGAQYTAASINTSGKQEFHYGRIEVRAKLPGGRGTWPAIWMVGTSGEWPDGGEIDIMENVGFEPNAIHCSVHTGADRAGGSQATVKVTPPPDESYHVYALEWFEDRLDFYVDTTQVYSYRNDGKRQRSTWPFDQPQYLIVGVAVGGSWGGQQGIDESIFPRRYYVDYVRYYK